MFALPKPEILAKPVAPEAAIAFWQARAAMTRKEAKELAQGARWRAFYVTGLAQHDMVETVKDAIGEALKTGETLADFKKRIGGVIEAAGWKGHRVDNIFRTNMQTAYAAGRYTKMQAVKATRPYWQYITVEDRRRRPSHAVLHGLVFPADHEFWSSNMPPNGFGCRCTERTLSERQLKREGLEVQTEMPRGMLYTDPTTGMEYHVAIPGADKGFANNPGKDWMAGLKTAPEPAQRKQRTSKRPEPVRTDFELCLSIKQRCEQFATNAGIRMVWVEQGKKYFMKTDTVGEFWLNDHSFPRSDGFNAVQCLRSAWNKLASGKKLTWHEEYSVESLWHEIIHNRQKFSKRLVDSETNVMEVVTQWTARRTYHTLLESLGGKASHQASIIKDGFGYRYMLWNFDRFLDVLGVKETNLLPALENLIKEKQADDYLLELSQILARMGKEKSPIRIRAVLRNIHKSKEQFEETLKGGTFVNQHGSG